MESSIAALVVVAVVVMLVVGVVAVVLVIPRDAKLEVDARRRVVKIDTHEHEGRAKGER